MKRSAFILSASAASLLAGAAFASSDQKHPHQESWPFDGVFGHVDKQSAQRGLQVYKEVCAACHGLSRVPFRTLTSIGFSEAEVKALAASYQVKDGPNDSGDMFERPGRPSDSFVPPYANEQAARAAQNGSYPPDLSLIIKARHDGANYVHALLNGYGETPPEGHVVPEGQYYNPYFPGGNIAMPAPLADDRVTYGDGTKATVEQMSHDLVNFLQWAAEPEMEHRKSMGIKAMLFLSIFTIFAYIAKKRIWSRIH